MRGTHVKMRCVNETTQGPSGVLFLYHLILLISDPGVGSIGLPRRHSRTFPARLSPSFSKREGRMNHGMNHGMNSSCLSFHENWLSGSDCSLFSGCVVTSDEDDVLTVVLIQ